MAEAQEWLNETISPTEGMEQEPEIQEPIEETPEPEVPKAEEAPEPVEEKEKGHSVPLPFMLREREARKETEKELERVKESANSELAALKEQLIELRAKVQPDKVPDPEEDPAAFLQHQQETQSKQINEKIETLSSKIEQSEAEKAQQAQLQQVQSQIAMRESEFVKEAPDYYDALNHVRNIQFNHLTQNGWTEERATQYIVQQEFQEAMSLSQLGYNPAQMIYDKAQREYGYSRPQPAEQPDPQKAEQLQNLDKTLGASGKTGGVDVKDMLTMSEEEFDKAWDSQFGDKRW